ncbi:MAG: hypothetical protein ACR2IE_13865 [Candidatus Sumerlaeaceae bacterium]
MASCSAAFAIPFDNTTVNGTVTIGDPSVVPGTYDYPSLTTASLAFNAVATPFIQGNWTVRLATNLTEAENCGWGNTIPVGSSLTIKPALTASLPVNVTFTTGSDTVAMADGHFLIGAQQDTAATTDNFVYNTDNFTIDGSANGTSSRDLIFQNTAAVGAAAAYIFQAIGPIDNTIIKNCIIRTGDMPSGTNEVSCFQFTSRYSTAVPVTPESVPTNGQVINCELRADDPDRPGVGFRSARSGATLTAGFTINGLVVANNDIYASAQAMRIALAGNANVYNNRITVVGPMQANTNNFGGAIEHERANASGWTMNIYNNRFLQLRTFGATTPHGIPGAIHLGPLDTGTSGTYNIYNNMIAGFDYNPGSLYTYGGSNTDATMNAIRIDQAPSCTYNIYHNSINIIDQPNITGTADAVGRFAAIAVATASFTGTLNIKNNVIRQAENLGSVFHRTAAASSLFSSDFNNSHLAGGLRFARVATTDYATLAAWQTSPGFPDANSTGVDPTVAQAGFTGAWVSATDLHFNAAPGPAYNGTPIALVPTDIDGDARSGSTPTKGVDEKASAANVQTWTLY